jgi:RNA polymerase sigma factor (sigma-70 family)
MEENDSLLESLRSGDTAAWSQAFELLWPIALHSARRLTLSPSGADAEGAASEALVQAVRRVGEVRSFNELKAFVAIIAYRRAISIVRYNLAEKRRAISTAIPVFNGEAENNEIASSLLAGLSDLELAELVLLLRELLSGLDTSTRDLVFEKVANGESYADLSRKYGMPLGTVCSKVARGLKQLRKLLDESPRLMKELKEFLR